MRRVEREHPRHQVEACVGEGALGGEGGAALEAVLEAVEGLSALRVLA